MLERKKWGGANKVSQFPGCTTKAAVWRAAAAAGSGTDRAAAAAAAAAPLQQTQKPNGFFFIIRVLRAAYRL